MCQHVFHMYIYIWYNTLNLYRHSFRTESFGTMGLRYLFSKYKLDYIIWSNFLSLPVDDQDSWKTSCKKPQFGDARSPSKLSKLKAHQEAQDCLGFWRYFGVLRIPIRAEHTQTTKKTSKLQFSRQATGLCTMHWKCVHMLVTPIRTRLQTRLGHKARKHVLETSLKTFWKHNSTCKKENMNIITIMMVIESS